MQKTYTQNNSKNIFLNTLEMVALVVIALSWYALTEVHIPIWISRDWEGNGIVNDHNCYRAGV